MAQSFVAPPYKALPVPASFAGQWEPEVYSQAVHKMVDLLMRVDFLTARLFTNLSEAQAAQVRGEISEMNRNGRAHVASVVKTNQQGLDLVSDAVKIVRTLPSYMTAQQKAALAVTGVAFELIKL